jgi:hypothetical protein
MALSRYFFHLVGSDRGEFRDEKGQRFDTLEDAAANAAKIADELAQDGDQYWGSTVTVTDESNNELMRIPVKAT